MPAPNQLPLQWRTISLTREAVKPDERSVEVVASTEEAIVDRWWGREQLVHQEGSIIMDRAQSPNGIPCLWGHDMYSMDSLLGRCRDFRLDTTGKCTRTTLGFDTSEEADKALQKIKDGSLCDVSIGYRVHEVSVVNPGKPDELYRVTRWEPMEVSLCSVPADPKAGVGRSAEPEYSVRSLATESPVTTPQAAQTAIPTTTQATTRSAHQEVRMDPVIQAGETANITNVTKLTQDTLAGERQRVAEITAMADKFQVTADKRAEWIGQGASVDQVRKEIMDGFRASALPVPAPTSNLLGLSAKEKSRYNLGAGLRALVSKDFRDAGFEREVSDGIAQKLGRATGGLFVPSDFQIKTRAANTMNTGTVGQGKELVFPEYMGFIDLLRNEAKTLALGARLLPGLQGTPNWVKQTSGSTFYWLGENPGADVTDSKIGMDVVVASPKTAKSMLTYTRQQMLQGIENIEALISADILQVDALAIDGAALVGTGSNSQPTGLLNTAGIGAKALGVAGGIPDGKTMSALRTIVKKANALGLGAGGYLSTPDIEDLLMNTPKLANQIAMPVWGEDGKVNGFRAESTNQMPSNLTKGASVGLCHAILFGIWQELFVLEWGALEITADPYTLSGQDVVRISTSHLLDIFVRRPAAFAACKDALLA